MKRYEAILLSDKRITEHCDTMISAYGQYPQSDTRYGLFEVHPGGIIQCLGCDDTHMDGTRSRTEMAKSPLHWFAQALNSVYVSGVADGVADALEDVQNLYTKRLVQAKMQSQGKQHDKV